jgi:CRP-like cAMP-binding protein
MSEPDRVEALAAAPLFTGLERRSLVEVARVMRPRSVAAGDVLWHHGAEAKGMAVIVEGRVAVTLRLPGDRSVEVSDAGPGETIGELPLIDGGPHSATARVTEAGSLLFFRRADFAPFVARDDPSAFALKRRLAGVIAARLRRQFERLAFSLGSRTGSRSPSGISMDPARMLTKLDPADPPDSRYLRRLATFRAADTSALDGLLSAGRCVRCPRGWTLEEEGGPATAFFMVINGTIERVLVRGDQRIRVGLAGPGQAFGYDGLIHGQSSPATAIARERAVLLVVRHDAFARLFEGAGSESLAFLDVLNRDLAGWLRRAARPQAYLAIRPVKTDGVDFGR